ncbi:MAG TPA: TRAP transporter small permease [Casimicrobiaceae bacterium]|nr:TRAP transporter small permease [Casimicrobiaceae bacterium]
MPSSLPSNRFTRGLTGLVDVLTLACGWWLIGLALMTCVEMVGRKLLKFSLQGVDEIGAYTFAVVSTIGFSYALITRGHTRVDFLVSRFSAPVRAALNFTAVITLTAIAVFGAYRAYRVLAETIDLGSTAASPLATPLWIPQSLWVIAFALFAVVTLVTAAYACKLFAAKAWPELNKRFGPQTLSEEIESETMLHVERDFPTRAGTAT